MKPEQLNHIAFGTLASAKVVGILSIVMLLMKHHTGAVISLCLYGILIVITLALAYKAMRIHNQNPWKEPCESNSKL
jgi:hypothetical protein